MSRARAHLPAGHLAGQVVGPRLRRPLCLQSGLLAGALVPGRGQARRVVRVFGGRELGLRGGVRGVNRVRRECVGGAGWD